MWFHAPFGDSLEAGLELLLHDVFPVSTQDPGHQLEQQRAVTEFQGVQQLKSETKKQLLTSWVMSDDLRVARRVSERRKTSYRSIKVRPVAETERLGYAISAETLNRWVQSDSLKFHLNYLQLFLSAVRDD